MQSSRGRHVVDYQNLNSCGSYCTDYIHLKMPTQFNKDPCADTGGTTGCSTISDMFHIHVKGYAYAVPSVIDITFVGYVTYFANGQNHDGLVKTKIFDATGNSCDTSCYQGCGTPQGGDAYEGCAIYHGSDSALYLRFKPSDLYHIAFSVDSMYVGNGYVLKRNDIAISMDGRGCWRDNVFVERLWKSVKYEEVYLHAYDSVSHAKTALGCYLDFYNARRPHSSLDRKTPDQVYFAALSLAMAA